MNQEVMISDGIMVDDMAMDVTAEGVMIEEPMMDLGTSLPEEGGISPQITLYIVIGICAVLGLVLGIILGRKAAYK